VIALRDYQEAGIRDLRERIAGGVRRVALVAPTGAGKTTIAGAMISGTVAKGNRCLFLAHRKELIEQCSARLDQFNISHGVIQANHPRTDPTRQVQVASISSLIRRPHWDAEVIIVDECHRSTSKTYKKIIERYTSPVVIGLTATPYRMDGKGLGEVYDFLHPLISTQELIDTGYLVMPTVFGSKIKLDLSGVRVTAGDYNRGDLADAMKETVLRGDLVDNWASRVMEYTGVDRVSDCRACTVVFAPSVEQSIKITEQFKAAGVPAAHVDAKTPAGERTETLRKLRAREISVVSNVGILCLDSETEILTSDGWAGIDTLSSEHDVANWWPDRRVTWSKPIDIIKRRRDVNERMVSVNGSDANIRVTEGHRMLSKKHSVLRRHTDFKTSKASDLVGKRCYFPTSGVTEDPKGLDREKLWSILIDAGSVDEHHAEQANATGRVSMFSTDWNAASSLQALAAARGMHATIVTTKSNGPGPTKPIYCLSVNRDKTEHQLVRDRLEFESEWKDEMVWCCNVESTYLITRRHGRVTVMGNCEGWDLPHLECVVLARPTRSRSMFKQMVGRLMRPDADKRFAFVLDHANCTQTHGFVNEAEEFSLESREARPRQGAAPAPHKVCSHCNALVGLRARECPACGAVQFRVDVRFTDERLVELKPGEVQRIVSKPVEERQKAFNEFCNQCMAREYKPNWARMRYQALYKEWPAWNSGIRVTRSFREYERAWDAAETKGQLGLLQTPK